MRDVVIISGARTPVGAFGGSLKAVPVGATRCFGIEGGIEKV